MLRNSLQKESLEYLLRSICFVWDSSMHIMLVIYYRYMRLQFSLYLCSQEFTLR